MNEAQLIPKWVIHEAMHKDPQLVSGRAQDYAFWTRSLCPLPQAGRSLAWSPPTLHDQGQSQSHPWKTHLAEWINISLNWCGPHLEPPDWQGKLQRQSWSVTYHEVTPSASPPHMHGRARHPHLPRGQGPWAQLFGLRGEFCAQFTSSVQYGVVDAEPGKNHGIPDSEILSLS